MSKEGFLPSRESDEEIWESYVITMGCKLYENRGQKDPVSFSPLCSLHLSQCLTHNQSLLFL